MDDELNELGLYKHRRCPHCHANLWPSESGRAICLNACDLPVWQYRKMQEGLREAAAKVDEEMQGGGK